MQQGPTSRPESQHASDPDQRGVEHDVPGSGLSDVAGPSVGEGLPTDTGTATAFAVTAPSNRTVFSVIATGILPDLHAAEPGARAVPRHC